jgi:hypothetical protein
MSVVPLDAEGVAEEAGNDMDLIAARSFWPAPTPANDWIFQARSIDTRHRRKV